MSLLTFLLFLNFYLSFYLFYYLNFIYLFIRLFIYLFIYLFINLFIYFFISLFICTYIYSSTYFPFSSYLIHIGMMIEEPFQRALKLEVFANTIRRDLSDLLHVTNISPTPLNITSEALGSSFV